MTKYRFNVGDEVRVFETIETEDEQVIPVGTEGFVEKSLHVSDLEDAANYYVYFPELDIRVWCFERDLDKIDRSTQEHIEHVEWERNRYLAVLDRLGIGACDVDDILLANEWPSYLVDESYYFLETEAGTPWVDLDDGEMLCFDTYEDAYEYGKEHDTVGMGFTVMNTVRIAVNVDTEVEADEQD